MVFPLTIPLTAQEKNYLRIYEQCCKIKRKLCGNRVTEGSISERVKPRKSHDGEEWLPKKRSKLPSFEKKSAVLTEKMSHEELEDGEILDDPAEPSTSIPTTSIASTSTPKDSSAKSCSLIVRGIDLTEDKLRKVFKSHADINCKTITVDSKQRSASIVCFSRRDAEHGVVKMNNYLLNGITIKVAIDRSTEIRAIPASITITINTQKKPKKERKSVSHSQKCDKPSTSHPA
ncbi:unnamed protein product [Caenorhabditis bovis]|uniref:RRM domain-containing protein n=1 Tax=Caenorhabditis bovis TaxID=2654633 RepID=A0A8S1EJ04_9PELO|nr:unnamed protein product [Caenorhabditis bovis]